jgi:hypothetical protein
MKGKKMKLHSHSFLINAFLRREQREMRVGRSVTTSVRLPDWLREMLLAKARREDLNFSQLVRRALRRELIKNGIPINGRNRK